MVDNQILTKYKIEKIVNKRTVCIVALGASIYELQEKIELFKDKDVCWMSMGLFTPIEDYILSKINKKLDIVFDCATVPGPQLESYEKKVRLPRLAKFLVRDLNENNLWITSKGIIRDSIVSFDIHLFTSLNEKVELVDDYFEGVKQIRDYMEVPNSLTLMIASALAGQASKIILFGVDGAKGDINTNYKTFFMPELTAKERVAALGHIEDGGLKRDSESFDKRFKIYLDRYRKLFNNNCKLLNCSPNSMFESIPKINYEEVLKEL